MFTVSKNTIFNSLIITDVITQHLICIYNQNIHPSDIHMYTYLETKSNIIKLLITIIFKNTKCVCDWIVISSQKCKNCFWPPSKWVLILFFLLHDEKQRTKDVLISQKSTKEFRQKEMLRHVHVYACTACVIIQYMTCIVLYQHICTSIHIKEKWKAQHRDPQTLNGVGVKGLVGERRRKSLLWLSPSYREETKGNNFRRQHT